MPCNTLEICNIAGYQREISNMKVICKDLCYIKLDIRHLGNYKDEQHTGFEELQ